MEKNTKRKKDSIPNFHEKPTKIPKKNEDTLILKNTLVDPNESQEPRFKQNVKELQSKNVALNISLAESQVITSNLQVEIARLEKKIQDFSKEKAKFEEMQFFNNKLSNDLAKEKQRNKDLHEKIEEFQKKKERNSEEKDSKSRKILNIIRKTKEISSVVGSLKGKFYEKIDILGSYKEAIRRIEELLLNETDLKENDEKNDGFRNSIESFLKEMEGENDVLRQKLEETQEKMRDSKNFLEKFQKNFDRIRDNNEEIKGEINETREENDNLKRQIDALERKSLNQTEIIEILKIRIKSFQEEEIEDNEEEEDQDDNESNCNENSSKNQNQDENENIQLHHEIESLDQEIQYIQEFLYKK